MDNQCNLILLILSTHSLLIKKELLEEDLSKLVHSNTNLKNKRRDLKINNRFPSGWIWVVFVHQLMDKHSSILSEGLMDSHRELSLDRHLLVTNKPRVTAMVQMANNHKTYNSSQFRVSQICKLVNLRSSLSTRLNIFISSYKVIGKTYHRTIKTYLGRS